MYITVHILEYEMTRVNFTEFRNNASHYLTKAEKGEVIKITRHGKIIAEIKPPTDETDKIPAWKKKGLRLSVKGSNLSSSIIEEREIE
jgi:antitoxin (DNA-binding transcriptional repressor) of toxin-antitoxin stability system